MVRLHVYDDMLQASGNSNCFLVVWHKRATCRTIENTRELTDERDDV